MAIKLPAETLHFTWNWATTDMFKETAAEIDPQLERLETFGVHRPTLASLGLTMSTAASEWVSNVKIALAVVTGIILLLSIACCLNCCYRHRPKKPPDPDQTKKEEEEETYRNADQLTPILKPRPDNTLSRDTGEIFEPTPHHYTLPRLHQTEAYYAAPSNIPVPPNTRRHPTKFE